MSYFSENKGRLRVLGMVGLLGVTSVGATGCQVLADIFGGSTETSQDDSGSDSSETVWERLAGNLYIYISSGLTFGQGSGDFCEGAQLLGLYFSADNQSQTVNYAINVEGGSGCSISYQGIDGGNLVSEGPESNLMLGDNSDAFRFQSPYGDIVTVSPIQTRDGWFLASFASYSFVLIPAEQYDLDEEGVFNQATVLLNSLGY